MIKAKRNRIKNTLKSEINLFAVVLLDNVKREKSALDILASIAGTNKLRKTFIDLIMKKLGSTVYFPRILLLMGVS